MRKFLGDDVIRYRVILGCRPGSRRALALCRSSEDFLIDLSPRSEEHWELDTWHQSRSLATNSRLVLAKFMAKYVLFIAVKNRPEMSWAALPYPINLSLLTNSSDSQTTKLMWKLRLAQDHRKGESQLLRPGTRLEGNHGNSSFLAGSKKWAVWNLYFA